MLVRSLGRRVSVEWVSKEVRLKVKLDYDLEVFLIADDHLILRSKSEKKCSLVRHGGSWFVLGHLLAMEAWEPDFVSSRRVIQKMIEWLRLQGLPLEY